MFNAKDKEGKIISLVENWKIEELRKLREESAFYCPICASPVRLRLGEKKVWHFAHQSKSACEAVSERETDYHLKGKQQLYEWLRSMSLEVELEMYLPEIKQRPDILLHHEGITYAIEYQCSPIPLSELSQRTKGYNNIGIKPIWILGGNRLNRHSKNVFSLRTFEWLTSKRSGDSLHLTYYCSQQRCFIQLHHMTPYSKARLLANLYEIPLDQAPLSILLTPIQCNTKKLSINDWMMIRKHWRYRYPSLRLSTSTKYFFDLLYHNKIPPNLFPTEVGWPTSNHYLIETSPLEWQTILMLTCLNVQPLHQPFTPQLVRQCFQPYIHRGVITTRFSSDHKWFAAILGYLEWLVQVHFLSRTDHGYRKQRELLIPKNVEEAIRLDLKILYLKTSHKNCEKRVRYNEGILHEKIE